MSGDVAIIDYGSGNLHSAEKAFARMAAPLGAAVRVTADLDVIRRAERLVLPGVGAFGDCAAGVAAIDGLRDLLDERVLRGGAPFLGICVGMQLMAERGLERGVFDGFGWISGDIARVEPTDPALKIPHMGWNQLAMRAEHPVLSGLGDPAYAYFVHSYALRGAAPASVLAEVRYGGAVVAVAGRDNLIGCQFHPEKSQRVGLRLIDNFLRWRP